MMDERPHEAPEWLWYGEINGNPVVSYGRWPKHGAVWRYKWAEIQSTEHDHGLPKADSGAPKTAGQTFEEIIKSLNYDGADTDSLTVGEIRRALR